MYKCNNCNCEFEEPRTLKTSYESYYGVSGEFLGSTPLEIEVCPCCEDNNFEIIRDDYEFTYLLVKEDNDNLMLYCYETYGMETWGMTSQDGIKAKNGKWYLEHWEDGGQWVDDFREENEMNVILETQSKHEILDFVKKNYKEKLNYIKSLLREIEEDIECLLAWE